MRQDNWIVNKLMVFFLNSAPGKEANPWASKAPVKKLKYTNRGTITSDHIDHDTLFLKITYWKPGSPL